MAEDTILVEQEISAARGNGRARAEASSEGGVRAEVVFDSFY